MSFSGRTVSTCHEFAALNAAPILACDLHRLGYRKDAAIAPAVERTLGKGEVACSNHAGSTIFPISYQTKANNRRDGLEDYWLSLRLVNIGASTQPI